MKTTMTSLGFSEGESALYQRLLELGACTISECLKGMDLSRPHAYSLMRNLVQRGLVAEEAGKPTRFRALPPEKSLEYYANSKMQDFAREKEAFLENLEVFRQEASVLFSKNQGLKSEVGPDMLVFRGPNLIAEWANTLKSNLKDCLRVVSKKPLILKMVGAEDIETDDGVVRKILCETELTADEDFEAYIKSELGRGDAEVRYSETLPIKLAIFDDFAAIIPLAIGNGPDDYLLLLTQNRELVTFLTIAFDCLWDNSLKYPDSKDFA